MEWIVKAEGAYFGKVLLQDVLGGIKMDQWIID